MNEGNLMRSIMLAVGRLKNVRIFRNNTGTGWQGEVLNHTGTHLLLKNPRPLHAGLCKGSSDLIGWTVREITPDMVGQKVAVFTAAEVKTAKGRPTAEQAAFLQRLHDDGGIAAICRSEADALKAVSGQ
jgi:hypothetical protein